MPIDANSVSASLATLGTSGWTTKEDGTYGGSGGGTFGGTKSITAVGSVVGTLNVTPGKTISFSWNTAVGITRCGVELMNGTTPIGYVDYPDGDNQLFVVPVAMTQLGYRCNLLEGAGSINLKMVST